MLGKTFYPESWISWEKDVGCTWIVSYIFWSLDVHRSNGILPGREKTIMHCSVRVKSSASMWATGSNKPVGVLASDAVNHGCLTLFIRVLDLKAVGKKFKVEAPGQSAGKWL